MMSPIDRQLQQYQQAQEQLVRQHQQPPVDTTTTTTTTGSSSTSTLQQNHHAWTMTIVQPSVSNSIIAATTTKTTDRDQSTSTTSTSGDGSLLAQHIQQQTMARMKRENAGLTTKAMRDLEQFQQSKLYTHVSLSIHVVTIPPPPQGNNNHPSTTTTTTSTNRSSGNNNNNNSDTIIVQFHGKFSPNDTIDTVMTALRQDCFLMDTTTTTTNNNNNSNIDFELYSTPPMVIYNSTKRYHTLQQEQLVPASKLFLRWIVPVPVVVVPSTSRRRHQQSSKITKASTPAPNPMYTSILQPKWLSIIESHDWNGTTTTTTTTTTNAIMASFPKSIPIRTALPSVVQQDGTITRPTKKPTPSNGTTQTLTKEELLLRRMMGGK